MARRRKTGAPTRCHRDRRRAAQWFLVSQQLLLMLLLLATGSLRCCATAFLSPALQRRQSLALRRRSPPPSFLLATSGGGGGSSSSSKTGGRLLESAEEYSTLVMNDGIDAAGQRPVLVFWTAPWCGPCRLSIPVVKEIIKLYANKIEALEVCTDDLPEVAADAGVVSIPTIHLYFRGKLLDTLIGCVAKQVLAGSVEKVLEDIAIKQKGAPGKNAGDIAP